MVVYCGREALDSLRAEPFGPRCEFHVSPAPSTSKPARVAAELTWLPWRARRDRLQLLHSLGTTSPPLCPVSSVVTVHDVIYHHFPDTFPLASRLGPATSSPVSPTASSGRCCRAGGTTARSARSTSTRASASGGSRRPSPSAAVPRRRRAASASPAAATACSGRSTRRTGKVLWTFQTGAQIAAGPTIYTVDGKEYIAITVGGAPTSSDGGLPRRGSRSSRSAAPAAVAAAGVAATALRPVAPPVAQPVPRRAAPRRRSPPRSVSQRVARVAHGSKGSRIPVTEGEQFVRTLAAQRLERADRDGPAAARQPAGGRRSYPRRYLPPAAGGPTQQGRFRYRADVTTARRHPITVVCASTAKSDGRRPPEAHRDAGGLAARGTRRVQRRLQAEHHSRRADRGRQGARHRARNAARGRAASGRALHLPALRHDHRLGRPARAGAVVVPRRRPQLLDVLGAERRQGHYTSFFAAADTAPTRCRWRSGSRTATFLRRPVGRNVSFRRLRSATLDIKIPTGGGRLLVRRRLVRRRRLRRAADRRRERRRAPCGRFRRRGPTQGPVSARAAGLRRGKAVSFWMDRAPVFSTRRVRPGPPCDTSLYPDAPGPRAPQGLLRLRLPR